MKFIDENLENMKADLKELVSYNSVNCDDQEPFGSENRKVLDSALKMMADKGFKTENLDYYCGYGEVGQGEKTIGILAHLDIVPVSDGWSTNPFEMVEKDGYLYGRGVSDDKGAAIASMYAIKYLLDSGYNFKKKVRLILGCNEETGSSCIRHYVEKCGHIDLGFTPDGDFPGIFAEKGMIGGKIVGPEGTKIVEISGGEASNIVCKKVHCVLNNGSINEKVLAGYLFEHGLRHEEWKQDGKIIIDVFGKAAHASTPDYGLNAINYLMEALFYAGIKDDFVSNFHKYLNVDNHGKYLGLEEVKDDITNTSINIGMISKVGDHLEATFDMRFPVKTTKEKCMPYLEKLNDFNCKFTGGGIDPLYFDINSPMIKALKKAYEDVTGDKESKMEAIGGGTYAKAINNCIAFGCEFPGENNHIHDDDECLSIESFKKQVEIYIEAIKNLNEVE